MKKIKWTSIGLIFFLFGCSNNAAYFRQVEILADAQCNLAGHGPGARLHSDCMTIQRRAIIAVDNAAVAARNRQLQLNMRNAAWINYLWSETLR